VHEASHGEKLLPLQVTWLDDRHVRVGVGAFSGRTLGWRLYSLSSGAWPLVGTCGEAEFPRDPDSEPPAGTGTTPRGCERGERPVP
jgi:hypothetical protein